MSTASEELPVAYDTNESSTAMLVTLTSVLVPETVKLPETVKSPPIVGFCTRPTWI